VVEELEATPAGADRRSRLWTIAHQYALSESAQAYGKAAGQCLVQPILSTFWNAIVDGDLDAARAAFNQAASLTGCADALRKEEAVLRLREEARDALARGSEARTPSGVACPDPLTLDGDAQGQHG
jgi:hypothetical protein